MSQKQLQRYRVMGLVEERRITLREAGEKIGVSHRQAKRIWQRVREKGVKGLIHGNTGRVAWNRISEVVREFVIQLFQIPKNSLNSGFHRSDAFIQEHQKSLQDLPQFRSKKKRFASDAPTWDHGQWTGKVLAIQIPYG